MMMVTMMGNSLPMASRDVITDPLDAWNGLLNTSSTGPYSIDPTATTAPITHPAKRVGNEISGGFIHIYRTFDCEEVISNKMGE